MNIDRLEKESKEMAKNFDQTVDKTAKPSITHVLYKGESFQTVNTS